MIQFVLLTRTLEKAFVLCLKLFEYIYSALGGREVSVKQKHASHKLKHTAAVTTPTFLGLPPLLCNSKA